MSVATLAPTSTTLQGIQLAPRRMAWDFSDAPACPVLDGDPDLAAFVLAVSYFAVAFEDFGIPVVRADMPKVRNHSVLARDVQAFISQEALHSQGHAQFNAIMSARHGFDTTAVKRECRRFIDDMSSGTQQDRLAAVAALEHVIYSIASWYEKARAIHGRIYPEFHRLILWHAMEETEHTAVVHDMYEHIYGTGAASYRRRIAALTRSTRIGARALYRIWQEFLPQMAQRTGRRPSPVRSYRAFAGEAARYLGDIASFVRPEFNPWSRPKDIELLPELRRQMVPAGPATAADSAGWLALEVASVREVAADVRHYEFVAPDRSELPGWNAGAHIDVEIETGIVRQYSLCGDPSDRRRYAIAVKREVLGRGGSLRLHQMLARGCRVRVGRPRNQFALSRDDGVAPEALLLAGGIGVTPLLAMAHALHGAGQPFRLLVCARDHAHIPFAQELAGLPFAARIELHVDTESAAASGRVDVARLIPAWDAAQPRQLYLCGPAPFMDAALTHARAAGWPESALRTERFTHEAGPRSDDRAFTLHLARRNIAITVPRDQTIVEAMEAHGLAPQSSCREGICGACVCRVLEGEVEHRDAILSETEHAEGHRMTICVSRARTERLTLDL